MPSPHYKINTILTAVKMWRTLYIMADLTDILVVYHHKSSDAQESWPVIPKLRTLRIIHDSKQTRGHLLMLSLTSFTHGIRQMVPPHTHTPPNTYYRMVNHKYWTWGLRLNFPYFSPRCTPKNDPVWPRPYSSGFETAPCVHKRNMEATEVGEQMPLMGGPKLLLSSETGHDWSIMA